MALPKMFTLSEAAEWLRCSVCSLRAEIHVGRLRAFRVRPGCNAPLLLAESDLLAWLDQHASKRSNVLSPKATAEVLRECAAAENRAAAKGGAK